MIEEEEIEGDADLAEVVSGAGGAEIADYRLTTSCSINGIALMAASYCRGAVV